MKNCLQELQNEFILSIQELVEISRGFKQEIDTALSGKPSSLPIVSYALNLPNGEETGLFCVLDIGGTRARASLIELQGQGRYKILSQVTYGFRDPQRDYTLSAADLFDFQANLIAEVIENCNYVVNLGYTFSFPCKQNNLNHCQLLKWAKEIKTPGVEGQDVVKLLNLALQRNGLADKINLVVTINDTVATLLTSAYSDPNTDIGSIIATGHNSCCVQKLPDGKGKIINLECGNYTGIKSTRWDKQIDLNSQGPGEQLYEKMVSGQYLGELVRVICLDLYKKGLWLKITKTASWETPYSLESRHLASILHDNSYELEKTAGVLRENWGITTPGYDDLRLIKDVGELVVNRSAQLIAASFAGILVYIDPALQHEHTIAIDGSVYENMPGFAENLQKNLYQILNVPSGQISLRLCKDGSSIGTAIAAAMIAQTPAR
ncbi:hypothetical protein [Syntrophomonas palmitatica]|uniref:hypothetical protein n=1 Tax=Syntrophomonas palmitatica TaxID=402877 RepID=UPI0006D1D54E|nr:hypothetical protein [Syntrophomonas palmitatica]